MGPALRHWLRTSFEPVPRNPDDDPRRLSRSACPAAAARHARCWSHNGVSSQAYEQIQNYAVLDEASFAGLGSLRAKTLNLMLHDLATRGSRRSASWTWMRSSPISAWPRTCPTAFIASGALQAEIRGEFVRVAAGRAGGVRGGSSLSRFTKSAASHSPSARTLRQRLVRRIAQQRQRRAQRAPFALAAQDARRSTAGRSRRAPRSAPCASPASTRRSRRRPPSRRAPTCHSSTRTASLSSIVAGTASR